MKTNRLIRSWYVSCNKKRVNAFVATAKFKKQAEGQGLVTLDLVLPKFGFSQKLKSEMYRKQGLAGIHHEC